MRQDLVHRPLALVALSFAACMPYAVPPATGAVGVTTNGTRGARAGVHAELGLSPAQMFPSLFHRWWDASLAATFERASGNNNDNLWGAALVAGPVLHPWGYRDDNPSSRVVPSLVGSWTTDSRGAGLRVAIERATFANTALTTRNGVGAYGEGALGFYIEAGYRWLDDDRTWTASAGITLRMPASAGIVCCIH